VFDHPTSFDPRNDSVVRVEAYRLRARLAHYYATDGRNDPIEIALPRGGYAPEFLVRQGVDPGAGSQISAARPAPDPVSRPAPSSRRRTVVLAGIALAVCASIFALVLTVRMRQLAAAESAPLVVLPFTVASDAPQDRQLAEGFADELTSALARIKGLRVIARTSASQFKDASEDYAGLASRLKVGAVVRGSVRRSGTRLRITVQLIRLPDAYHAWAESYEREEGDLVALQDEISWGVASALGNAAAMRASGGERRPIPAAYDLYLKGRSLRGKATPEALLQSVALFEAATASDPSYALAHAAVADVHATLAFHGLESPADAMARARSAADRALSLDPALAEAHAAAALVRFTGDWDWPAAEREFLRATELSPSAVRTRIWYAFGLATRRRPADALAQMAVARQLDPLSLDAGNDHAMILFFARRYQEAASHARRALEANPRLTIAHVLLGECLVATGRYGEAVEEFRRAIDPSGRISLVVGRMGHALAMAGRHDEARALLRQVETAPVRSGTPNTEMAFIYAGLGEKGRAFECLDAAFAAREGELLFLDVAPAFDGLRSDSRFETLARKVGLRR
jgi:serine/threonine-protein kinase